MALNVLVTFASRHGATASIADEIGSALDEGIRAAGVAAFVDVLPVEHVASVDRYDVVVVGSAVYLGRWLSSARRFVLRNAASLVTRPVWLFSSGPVGDLRDSAEPPRDVVDLVRLVEARGHEIFAGCIDRGSLGVLERLVVRLVNAPYRDDRDFAAVRSWAAGVAATTVASLPATAGGRGEPR